MEIIKATLKSFNAGTYTATLQPEASLAGTLSNIAVARNIPAAEMVDGRTCAILFYDPASPLDCVVVAVHG